MNVSTFYEKLNKVDGNVYVVEEVVHPTDGVYGGSCSMIILTRLHLRSIRDRS